MEKSTASPASLRNRATKPVYPPPNAEPVPGKIPRYPIRVDRRTAAALVTQLYFPVSYRTVEGWPLIVRHVNGKATVETAELFAFAQAKLDAAPPIKAGRGRTRSLDTAAPR